MRDSARLLRAASMKIASQQHAERLFFIAQINVLLDKIGRVARINVAERERFELSVGY
jgi:hypothetical protein